MSVSALCADAMHESFMDVRPLIISTVRAFQKSYGGDFDDLYSEAMESYMCNAWPKFDPERAKWSTYVRYRVWHDLLESARKMARRKVKVYAQDMEDYTETPAPVKFDAHQFLLSLSDDAKTMAELVIHCPEDFEAEIRSYKGVTNVSNYRDCLHDYFRTLGWSVRRISESFQEVQEALQ